MLEKASALVRPIARSCTGLLTTCFLSRFALFFSGVALWRALFVLISEKEAVLARKFQRRLQYSTRLLFQLAELYSWQKNRLFKQLFHEGPLECIGMGILVQVSKTE